MKKIFVYSVMIVTLIINIYFIFYWQPQEKYVAHENKSEEVISYQNNLYKIDKNQILVSLSSDEKKDLEKIFKKLSTLDMGKIKEYFEDKNDNEGVVNSFLLLKKRLAEEDYKRVEEISAPYLDIDQIHKEMKNKK